ncbi:16S rRNA (guanine(527)-N(7))-methyltransferase RsmG [Tunturibacter empetritectus]|uniref:Ribosomal RNA small subunit methyltransferase G n=1 Tax=Tunturiibacter empetritectus TaxID=3069691 RepID=A0A7W8IJV6_9BACT|nr:16S rRNA (guanine(527)-N(7))-methyltransferase RsmG [Edaphobacter lichenicola]MBB5318511.1 16S rRNA (guanine527-N7)-methyltransferase [Edaphobacter lichenicola]
MPTLSEAEIASLLTPYLPDAAPLVLSRTVLSRLAVYLELLLKWNARTNLTAIRDPEEIVRRHFGESLFAGQHLAPGANTLLDFGSGAGFPGLPIAILHPEIAVTLAESQNKKATFLREVVRTLAIPVEIWAARVETMPEARQFHTITLRAVDNMASALAAAAPRATNDLLLLAGATPPAPPGFILQPPIQIPTTQSTVLVRATRDDATCD